MGLKAVNNLLLVTVKITQLRIQKLQEENVRL